MQLEFRRVPTDFAQEHRLELWQFARGAKDRHRRGDPRLQSLQRHARARRGHDARQRVLHVEHRVFFLIQFSDALPRVLQRHSQGIVRVLTAKLKNT